MNITDKQIDKLKSIGALHLNDISIFFDKNTNGTAYLTIVDDNDYRTNNIIHDFDNDNIRKVISDLLTKEVFCNIDAQVRLKKTICLKGGFIFLANETYNAVKEKHGYLLQHKEYKSLFTKVSNEDIEILN